MKEKNKRTSEFDDNVIYYIDEYALANNINKKDCANEIIKRYIDYEKNNKDNKDKIEQKIDYLTSLITELYKGSSKSHDIIVELIEEIQD